MWILFSLIGLTIGAVFVLNSSYFTNQKIGITMKKFTEVKTQWTDIDFTTAIIGETPFVSKINHKSYPSLEKYRINGIYGIKNVLLVYGSDEREVTDKWEVKFGVPLSDENYVGRNEKAYIFRSIDDGKTFDKICLGHGTVEYSRNPPIFTNNTLYIQVDEQDTKKIRYYRSTDLGKTWVSNAWKPSFAWSNGMMFIEHTPSPYEEEILKTVTMSQDGGKTWHPLSGTLKEFYDKTQSLQQLNDHTIVGMTENKEFLFLDLKTMQIEKKVFEIPEHKKIVGFAISNHQLGLEIEEYTLNEGSDTQTSYYFPETKEYVHLPKQLPYQIYWDVKDNYIGGFFNYGDEVFGVPVHVYTLDRGKTWKYEILDKYNLMKVPAYIDGQLWFVASKDSAGGIFLTKGKVE